MSLGLRNCQGCMLFSNLKVPVLLSHSLRMASSLRRSAQEVKKLLNKGGVMA